MIGSRYLLATTVLITRPPMTGSSTVWTRDTAIPQPSTSVRVSASSSIRAGVMIGEIRVDTLVIATDRATSPFDRKVITLEEVPPGTEPSISRPTASAGFRSSTQATKIARSGMITNWATTPMMTGTGRFAIILKSGMVSVSPIANMMIIRKMLM